MNQRMTAKGRRGWAIVGVISLLVVGAVLGVAVDRHLAAPAGQGMASDIHNAAMASLTDRLDLAPGQRRQIDSIMAAHHDVLARTWTVLHAQLGAAVDTVHQDIEAVLTAEQRAEFREWVGGAGPMPHP